MSPLLPSLLLKVPKLLAAETRKRNLKCQAQRIMFEIIDSNCFKSLFVVIVFLFIVCMNSFLLEMRTMQQHLTEQRRVCGLFVALVPWENIYNFHTRVIINFLRGLSSRDCYFWGVINTCSLLAALCCILTSCSPCIIPRLAIGFLRPWAPRCIRLLWFNETYSLNQILLCLINLFLLFVLDRPSWYSKGKKCPFPKF